MKSMIFLNKSSTVGGDIGNILFRIGEGCATNCYNCTSPIDQVSYTPYSEYQEIFARVKTICDKELYIFFYGVEAIYHPDIKLYLEDKNLEEYSKSLHITPLYEKNRITTIENISSTYKNVSFDTCYTIKNKRDLISVLKFIGFLKGKSIKSTIDLFFDFTKYLQTILLFLKKYKNISVSHKPLNTHLGNENCIEITCNSGEQVILLYHTKLQTIGKDRINNLPLTLCAVKESFTIKDKNVYVSEEIEFTKDGDITIHFGTYCSKGIQTISSIYKDGEDIIKDFHKLDKYLQNFSDSDMGRNCFECISKPYNNEG